MKKIVLLTLLLALGLFAWAGYTEPVEEAPYHMASCCPGYPFPQCPPECSGEPPQKEQ